MKGPPPPMNGRCSAWGCISNSQQRHHLWPKSYLRGQPYEYVQVPWGKVIQNSTGLCVRHHDMVTIHKAAILVEGGHFMWAERDADGGWEILGGMNPQPPVKGDHAEERRPHATLGEGESCPTCGYQKPTKRDRLPARATSIWGVTVPHDAELGAEVLDEWVDSFAIYFGFGDEPSRLKRYHVLALILAWGMQNKVLLIRDISESQSN